MKKQVNITRKLQMANSLDALFLKSHSRTFRLTFLTPKAADCK